MRLLHTKNLELREFLHDVPSYAILSHTWVEGEEVTFQEMLHATRVLNGDRTGAPGIGENDVRIAAKSGFDKTLSCCQEARRLDLD